MKTYNVAILGATGAVGQQMIRVLEERNFPVGTLLPLASARSVGKTISFRGQEIAIQEATENSFEGMDFVLGAVQNAQANAHAAGVAQYIQFHACDFASTPIPAMFSVTREASWKYRG